MRLLWQQGICSIYQFIIKMACKSMQNDDFSSQAVAEASKIGGNLENLICIFDFLQLFALPNWGTLIRLCRYFRIYALKYWMLFQGVYMNGVPR